MGLQNVKSILIGITAESDEAMSSALNYGLSLSRQAGAHASIHVVSVRLAVTYSPISDVAAGLVVAENNRLRGLAEATAENARQEAAAAGVPCTAEASQMDYNDLTSTFAIQARVHDITVLDGQAHALAIGHGLLEEVLFESGRPVIVVPRGIDAFSVKRVIVAWDGSAKAARALHDALPLLRDADQVELVSIVGEKDLSTALPGAEIAPQLARHNIKATILDLPAQKGDAAETLRQHASNVRADLIIMGAYAHSRLRQLILGGVTRSLLKSAPVPLFLSH